MIACHPDDPFTLYVGPGSGNLWKSINHGTTWKPTFDDQSTFAMGDLAISPSNPNTLWLGTDDGNIQITRNDGKSWTQIDGHLPNKWVSRVRASRHDARTLYTTFTGYRDDDFQSYIYQSTNLGKSWTSIAGNLPPEPINVILEDPRDANILYIGTDLGVYITLNQGKDWHSLSKHIPTSPVHDLVIQERELDLVAGTHGRSIFVLDIEGIGK